MTKKDCQDTRKDSTMIFRAARNADFTAPTKTIMRQKSGDSKRFRRSDKTAGRVHGWVTETCQVLKTWQVWSFKGWLLWAASGPRYFSLYSPQIKWRISISALPDFFPKEQNGSRGIEATHFTNAF